MQLLYNNCITTNKFITDSVSLHLLCAYITMKHCREHWYPLLRKSIWHVPSASAACCIRSFDSMPPFQPDTTSPNHSPALLAYLWLYISDFFLFIIQCKRRPRICVQSPVPFRSIPQLSPFSFAAQDFIFYTADRVDEFAILREINIIIFLTWCDFWKAGIVSYM